MKNWIISITAAVLYLLISISTSAWQFTWLIWVGYAVYRLIEGRISRQTR